MIQLLPDSSIWMTKNLHRQYSEMFPSTQELYQTWFEMPRPQSKNRGCQGLRGGAVKSSFKQQNSCLRHLSQAKKKKKEGIVSIHYLAIKGITVTACGTYLLGPFNNGAFQS